MSDLAAVYHRLSRRLNASENYFTNVVATSLTSNSRWLVVEGIVSQCWQAWSSFCRDLVMASALGCITRSGSQLPTVVAPATWERVSYVAICAAAKGSVQANKTNNTLRREPTWGDVVKIGDIIDALSPANAGRLRHTFGAISRGPVHLQKVRNASAHINQQTFAELKALRISYIAPALRHPTDAAFWIDPHLNDYAFISWLSEMRALADYATQ